MNLRTPAVSGGSGERQLTGRMVLAMLVGFFGLVMVVNVFMIRAAISTFGGVDTPSSYKAGLAYKSEEAAAAAQDARNWKVEARLTHADGSEVVTIDVLDDAGRPVAAAEVSARFAHPVDERRDVVVPLVEIAPGTYSGSGSATAGQWVLDIEVSKAGERLFRSQNRVFLD
ncbi:MAG TPA: FixH family protein [Bauldia sp.]|nr:FixH family protein [Bauldia sp.]